MLHFEKEQQTDAATIEFEGNVLNLKKGFHIVGRRSKSIQIDDQSIDEKHALIWIKESGQHLLIDLESIKGTFVDNEKIDQSYNISSKTTHIKFGNILVKYTTLNQSDSGFLDSKIATPEKDTSEIVASSPEQSRNSNGTRFRNRYRKNNVTSSSTPNSKQFDSLHSNEEYYKEKEKNSKTNAIFDKNADRTNEEDDSSFIVPETQPFELNRLPKKGNVNIFDTIEDENVKQYINDMSRDDDYYVPETQEIFTNSKKFGSDDMVFINTQDFNASENNGSDSNDNQSEDLCAHLEKSVNDITLKIDLKENKSKKNEPLDETEDMTQLKWNETEFVTRSNATTPDFDFENKNEEKQFEQAVKENNLQLEREGSVTPDLIFDNIAINQSLPKADIKNQATIIQKKSPNKNLEQSINDYMDDENLLIPTQPFPFTAKSFSPKPKPTINFNDDYELLEETQLFIDPIPKTIKENITPAKEINEFLKPAPNILEKPIDDIGQNLKKPIDENKFLFIKPVTKTISESSKISNKSKKFDEDDEESICTQVFVAPQKICNNESNFRTSKNNSTVKNLNSTTAFIESTSCDSDATQQFILEEIEKENNKSHANDTLKSKTNRKRCNITLKASHEDHLNYEPETKKKVSSIKSVSKTSSYSSHSSTENFNSPIPTASGKSVTSKDADFMLDVCTPSIDLIKLPISEQGYVEAIKNIKKPKNRIYLEETEDDEDDEIIELEKIIHKNEKENNTKNALKDKRQNKTNGLRTNLLKKEAEQNLNSKSRNKKKSTESVKTDEKEVEEQSNKRAKSTNVQQKKKGKSNEEIKTTKKNTKMEKLEEKNKSDDSCKTSTDLFDIPTGRKSSRNKSNSAINCESDNAISENSVKTSCSTRSSRSSKRNKMTLTFTKVNEAKYIKTVQNIGYAIVKNPEEAGLIITNNEISRTWKFLIGLAKGIPIISVDWLSKIEETNFSFVPYDNFYVNDKKAEKRFNFRLRDTLNLATKSKQPLFNKFNFLITENTVPPKSEMEKIIHCAGGVLIDSIEKFSGKNLYVVSDRKDSKQWSHFKNSLNNVKILKVEGILLSIMQHRIRFDDHIF